MSKKETRRAAREAFPKAKNPAPKKSTYSRYSRSSRPARPQAPATKARSSRPATPGARKPTWRGSFIYAAFMVAIFLLAITFFGHTRLNFLGYVVLGLAMFVVYAPLAYFTNTYSYKKRVERMAKAKASGDTQTTKSAKVQKSKSK